MASMSIKGHISSSDDDLLKCFVCGSRIINRYYLLSSVRCQTSGMKVAEILSQLIGELYCIVISESDVICRCCTSLLNTYDKLECLKNQLCSIMRQNLKENYSAKQGLIDFEESQDLFSVKPCSPDDATGYGPNLLTQSDSVKLEGKKSIVHTAFKTLQLDLSQFPSIDQNESTFSEQINPALPVSQDYFVQSDIENQIRALSDVNPSYICSELSLNCGLGDFQRSFIKMDTPEEENLSLNSKKHGITLANEVKNIGIEEIDEKSNAMNECLSNGEHMVEPSMAENFYVQIVHETGETSRRVLTLDNSSAQVLKHNWEEF